MNENTKQVVLIPFTFESQQFRAIQDEHGEPWVFAKDVCAILDLGNVGQAISSLDDDEKSSIDPNIIIPDVGFVGFDAMMKAAKWNVRSVIPEAGRGGRPLALVNESGLYALIFKSRKPQARAFRKWVTSEVLPALRKHGHYETPNHRRESRAHIFHHRGPVSKSGLDIRYTMDLTRIALKPEPGVLTMVQRLTGVDMEDIIEELEAARTARDAGPDGLLAAWFEERCALDPNRAIAIALLYDDLAEWWKTHVAGPEAGCPPSRKALSQWLTRRGFLRRRPGGVSTFYGFGPA